MTSDDLRFDPRAILEILRRHDVRFLVVGGIAGRLHGSARMTEDLDICYSRTTDDLDRLAAALAELDISLRGADPGLPFRPDARTLRSGLNFTFDTRYGPFDCLGEASGYTYEVLVPNAERAQLDGLDVLDVLVVSLDDLIRMKRAAGRPQDIADVEILSKLREVRERMGLYGLAEPPSPPVPSGRGPRSRARGALPRG